MDTPYKRSVELDEIGRDLCQFRQARLAGAEIIIGKAHFHLLQFLSKHAQTAYVRDQALMHFKHHSVLAEEIELNVSQRVDQEPIQFLGRMQIEEYKNVFRKVSDFLGCRHAKHSAELACQGTLACQKEQLRWVWGQ